MRMKIRRLLLISLLLLLIGVVAALAQERVDLTVSETRTTTYYEIDTVTLSVRAKSVYVVLVGQNGEVKTKVYDATTTPTGATLLTSLNTSNNSTISLMKRVYTRLVTDGVITGTVSGTPQ